MTLIYWTNWAGVKHPFYIIKGKKLDPRKDWNPNVWKSDNWLDFFTFHPNIWYQMKPQLPSMLSTSSDFSGQKEHFSTASQCIEKNYCVSQPQHIWVLIR